MPIGICPACNKRKPLSAHHILKYKIFHNDEPENIIYLCEGCHNHGLNCLEELIRERENDVLRNKPELYTNALADFLAGVRPKKQRRRRRK